MTERELLEIVHTLRSNKDCSDADLCEVIKAANQTINLQNLATLIKTSPKQKSKNEALKFTKKELNQMPHKFKKLFTYNKAIAHVRLTSRNVYEVRCMIDGVCYFGSSKDLEVAKSKFIESLRNGSERSKREKGKILFNDYFLRWMETVKKPYIKESTYDGYMQVFKAYIQDTFKELPLAEIDSFFLQDLINGYTQSQRFRTAKKIYNLLSPSFDYAVADGMLDRNPMAKEVIPKYEIKQGSPLTYEEEAKLLNALKETGNVYAQAYVFLVYTGLRVGELSTAEVNGDWIEAVTEKNLRSKDFLGRRSDRRKSKVLAEEQGLAKYAVSQAQRGIPKKIATQDFWERRRRRRKSKEVVLWATSCKMRLAANTEGLPKKICEQRFFGKKETQAQKQRSCPLGNFLQNAPCGKHRGTPEKDLRSKDFLGRRRRRRKSKVLAEEQGLAKYVVSQAQRGSQKRFAEQRFFGKKEQPT